VAIASALLSTMGVGTPDWQSSLYMFLTGLGVGMIIQVMVLAVQNSVEHKDLGTATATESFSRSMGGAFGVAISGAILTNRITAYLVEHLPKGVPASALDAKAVAAGPKAIAQLPAPVRTIVIDSLANGIHLVFLFAVPLCFIAFVLALMLPERPLRTTAHIGVEAAAGEPLLPETEDAAIHAGRE